MQSDGIRIGTLQIIVKIGKNLRNINNNKDGHTYTLAEQVQYT